MKTKDKIQLVMGVVFTTMMTISGIVVQVYVKDNDVSLETVFVIGHILVFMFAMWLFIDTWRENK